LAISKASQKQLELIAALGFFEGKEISKEDAGAIVGSATCSVFVVTLWLSSPNGPNHFLNDAIYGIYSFVSGYGSFILLPNVWSVALR
jgi:hypothetical protein